MPYNLTGYNIINGTPSAETLTGTILKDAIYGNGGADTLNGGLGSDVLFGGAAGGVTFVYSADGVWGTVNAVNTGDPSGAGPGTSFGLTGHAQSHDVFVGSGTNNSLVIGDGARALFLEDNLSPTVDTQRLYNIQKIIGGNGGQVIDLTSSTITYGAVTIVGGSGNDVLMSNAGADTITAGDGDDYVWGGSGNDALSGGAGNDRVLGGTGNDTLDGGTGNDTLTGGAGNDNYTVDSASDSVVESSGQGTDTVTAALNYTLGSNVERLILTGVALTGTGNTLDNTIQGTSANNTLDGGTGNDTLAGGLGDDTYVVDNANDVVTELAGQGTDTVRASASYVLSLNLENLVLTGSSAISGTGNALANTITGNSGANAIDGGAGADLMQGGTGNDTYIVDQAGDIVSEGASAGTDHVRASVSYTLGDNVELLTLDGSANIDGAGNTLNNTLTGNVGDNVLDGAAGSDAMAGGSGNDTYVVDTAGDTVTELLDAGIDLVRASVTHTLAANVENLTLTGAAALSGTGNSLHNVITGNSGNNTLTGLDGNDWLSGGAGNDSMNGGSGSDTFVVDSAGDVTIEGVSMGVDHVRSSVTHALSANIENLTLTGTSTINGTGNGLDNKIVGNVANNVIDASMGLDIVNAGDGNDTIYGGDGNDSMFGENGNDTIYGNTGNDNVNGGAGLDLLIGGAGNDGLWGGGAVDSLRGEAGDDKLYGDGGNDLITGGAGNDWMFGGQLSNGYSVGNDTFIWALADVVTGTGTRAGFDTILDFAAGDRLDFSAVFSTHAPALIADLVHVTDTASGTLISLHISNSVGYIDSVILRGIHGVDLADLIADQAIFI